MGNCCGTATLPSDPEPKKPTSQGPQPQRAQPPSEPPQRPEPPPEPPRPAKTAQTIHQSPKSSLDVSYQKSSTVVPSSHGKDEKYARPAFRDKGETVTTSTNKPRAATPRRVWSQDWESSEPHHDGTDTGYLPSFRDALAPQDPRRQETVPRLPSSGRMNRMNSENVFGNGRTPRFGPYLTPGGPTPVEKQEGRPRFTSTLQSLLANHTYAVTLSYQPMTIK
jgi:hypothetical protein